MVTNNINSNQQTKDYDDLMKKINSILQILCIIVICFIIYICIKSCISKDSIMNYFLIGLLSIIMVITIKTIKNHDTYRSVSNYMKFERWLIHLLWFFKDDNNIDKLQYNLDDNPNIDWYVYGSVPIYVMIRLGYMLLIIAMYLFLVDYNLILAIICLMLGAVLIALPRSISFMIINRLANRIEEKNSSIELDLVNKRKSPINSIILLLIFVSFIIINVNFYEQIEIKNLLLLDLLAITIIFSICYIIDSITKSIKLNKKIRKYKKERKLNKDGEKE